MKPPSPDALMIGRDIDGLIGSRPKAPVRRMFFERSDLWDESGTSAQTPLLLMLRGGRGGSVRLKLYLTLLWVAGLQDESVDFPARVWAMLLSLRDPASLGARRVNDAVKWLQDYKFIAVETQLGKANRLIPLDERGTGQEYELPGAVMSALRRQGAAQQRTLPHRYVQLPRELWTNGWLAAMSAAGVAMYLVLKGELRGRDPKTTDVWFSPEEVWRRYGLSEDLRGKGLGELVEGRIAKVRREPIASSVLEVQRNRNVYRLNESWIRDRDAIRPQIRLPKARPMSFFEAQLDDDED